MTEVEIFNALEKNRGQWDMLARVYGAKDHEVDQVIQDAYISVLKYADYDKISGNGSVSGGYMASILRTRVVEIKRDAIRKKYLLARDEDDELLLTNFGGEDVLYRYEVSEWCDQDRLEYFFTILHDTIKNFLGEYHLTVWLLVTCNPEKMSYRDVQKLVGVSHMKVYGVMKKVKDLIKEEPILEAMRHNWELTKIQ